MSRPETGGWSRRSLLAAGLSLLAACGTLSDTNGGDENLPNRGIVPLVKAAPEGSGDTASILPFVWADPVRQVLEPSAVVLQGQIALYAESRGEDDSAIWRATSADGMAFGGAAPVLEPQLAWEGAHVGAPSVLVEGGTFSLWYLGGDAQPAIGLARSADGMAFEREADPVVQADPGETLGPPAVARLDAVLVMLVPISHEAAQGEPTTSIVRFDSSDGVTWTRRGAVLDPGAGCLNEEGEETRCWDGIYVNSPGIRVSRSPVGQLWFDLWYTGGVGGNSGLGFAGSYNGLHFSRHRSNPVLDDSGPESGPSVIEVPGGLDLYYSDRLDGRLAVAVALHRP